MQTENALINDRLRVSKPVRFAIFEKVAYFLTFFNCLFCL